MNNQDELKRKGAEFIKEYSALCEKYGLQIEPRLSMDVVVTPPKITQQAPAEEKPKVIDIKDIQ